MTRKEFLADGDVRDMLAWLVPRLSSDSHPHSYVNRQTGKWWHCSGLYDAFRQYRWRAADWTITKQNLDKLRTRLRNACRAGPCADLVACCGEILAWGGVPARNRAYLHSHADTIQDELRHMSTVLTAERTPSGTDMRRDPSDPSTECRMNAGLVKIYSLLLDRCVIYDGRVGAALGLLVREFCVETARPEVPGPLAFAFGQPKEGPNPSSPKHRDPSLGPYKFPRLRPDPLQHTIHTMRANWLLREALRDHAGPFSAGENGFHEVAAALFMVGYDVSEATTAG
jgi:hypothetical protein